MKSAVLQTVPFLDLQRQYHALRAEIQAVVLNVLETQHYVLGRYNQELEAAIAKDLGVRQAIGVASGTDALYLVLAALGVGPGDEVVTTPFTFFATAGVISRCGARPVFVDIDPETFQIDPGQIEKAISPRTRAILPVHLFGLCADMAAILKIAKDRKLPVIEDAAQAYGATFEGRPAGSMGDAGCLSFYPTKNLGGAGDGGMVVTSDAALADRIRLLRVHGSKVKYRHEVIGINSRLDELQAAVLTIKLKFLARWNEARRSLAKQYDEGLNNLPLQTPMVPGNCQSIYHLYTIRTPRRDDLAAFLSSEGIGTGVYYPIPMHLQPCYASLGHREGDFPASEAASREVLSLPMFPEMTAEEADRVIEGVRRFFKK